MKPIQKNINIQILIKDQIYYNVINQHSSFRELRDHLHNDLIGSSVWISSGTTIYRVVFDTTININKLLIQTLCEYQFATE